MWQVALAVRGSKCNRCASSHYPEASNFYCTIRFCCRSTLDANSKLVYWISLCWLLVVIFAGKLSAWRPLSNTNLLSFPAASNCFFLFFFLFYCLIMLVFACQSGCWSTCNRQLFLASFEIVSRNFMCNIMCCNDAAIAMDKNQVWVGTLLVTISATMK